MYRITLGAYLLFICVHYAWGHKHEVEILKEKNCRTSCLNVPERPKPVLINRKHNLFWYIGSFQVWVEGPWRSNARS